VYLVGFPRVKFLQHTPLVLYKIWNTTEVFVWGIDFVLVNFVVAEWPQINPELFPVLRSTVKMLSRFCNLANWISTFFVKRLNCFQYFLWDTKTDFWHVREQYRTILQREHHFNSVFNASSPSWMMGSDFLQAAQIRSFRRLIFDVEKQLQQNIKRC
jgi:hypothetical protein